MYAFNLKIIEYEIQVPKFIKKYINELLNDVM